MKLQGSGFLIGLVVGLLVGLALALGVAVYVNKVPIPFINKVPQRTADQDAAEAEKNKDWDPNSALRGKAVLPPPPATGASVAAPTATRPGTPSAAPAPAVQVPAAVATPARPTLEAPAVRGGPAAAPRDPMQIAGDSAASAPARVASAPALRAGPDPFIYFVQAGAFTQTEDAEQQRAKLAMLGFEARLSEREQSGRTMFRVRVGPFDKRDEAEAAREKLIAASVEASLVRVQR